MAEQFQCRFCQNSYNEVQDFLDHFEIHMNQNVEGKSDDGEKSNKDQNAICGTNLDSYEKFTL